MWLGQAFLSLSYAWRGWQHLTALLGSLNLDPTLEWWHMTLSSGLVAFFHRERSLGSTSWLVE